MRGLVRLSRAKIGLDDSIPPNLNRRAAKLYFCVGTAFKEMVPWNGVSTEDGANGS